jgi:hypothetical protein
MKAEEHIIAWIESSRPHYDRLLEIERRRHPDAIGAFYSASVLASHALALVISSYAEMISCGDASREDPYSASELFEAAKLVAAWELES